VRPEAFPVLLRAIRPEVILEGRILVSHIRDRPPVAAVRASASRRRLSTIRKDAATPTLPTGQIGNPRSKRILARCAVPVLEVHLGACVALLGIEDFRVRGLHLFFLLGLDVPRSGSWRSTSASALCRPSYQSYASVQRCPPFNTAAMSPTQTFEQLNLKTTPPSPSQSVMRMILPTAPKPRLQKQQFD
jgi:hypothetical protein